MRAEIISVGTEILLGDILNTNAQYLARELAGLGISLYYQSVVGDNPVRLRELVLEAKSRSEILILTGGLGPTADDLTKETLAEAFGDTLVLDEEYLDKLVEHFAARGWPMAENNAKQAMVPKNGRSLPNPNGTAPGAYFRQGARYAFLLPGPPREMQPMFENEVRPVLEGMQSESIRSLVLKVVGMGESDLETKVIDLLDNANPTAALYAKEGEVQVRITARAPTADLADAMCAEYATLFHQILGDVIYSADSANLETTVVGLLAAKRETVALAESCTGGLLAGRITSVPGASEVFGLGAVTYSNSAKQQELGVSGATLRRYGAVSSQVAAEMAFGAAKAGRANYGVGITGIAGPDGGTAEKPVGLVYVAVAKGNTVHIRKLNIGNRNRDFVRSLATTNALDMLRRIVAGLPLPQAKSFTKSQQADLDRESAPLRKGGPIVRAVVAIVVVIALIIALLVGINYFSQSQQPDARPGYPTSQGLRYGTEEYAQAARAMVKSEAALDPTVTGLIALPGGLVEDLVVRSPENQTELAKAAPEPNSASSPDSGSELVTLAANAPGIFSLGGDAQPEPDNSALAKIGADAMPGETGRNVLMLGGDAFSSLFELVDTSRAGDITTFTWFTGSTSQVYRVCALFLLDDAEEQADGFDPAVTSIPDNASFLTFLLGTRMRSLYDLPISIEQDDSFMILSAEDPTTPGRRLYLCGRAARAEETGLEEPLAAPAGAVLMPASLYGANNLDVPSMNTLYAYWMRWYLTDGVTNSELQLRAGMPEADIPLYGLELKKADIDLPQPPDPSESGSGSGEDISGEDSSSGDASSDAASAGSAASASSSEADSSTTQASEPADSADSSALPDEDEPNVLPPAEDGEELLTVTLNGQVVSAPAASILAQIVQNEAANLAPEVQKAVAIAAHSWILNQQAAGNEAPNVVGKLASTGLLERVEEVAGYIISGDGISPAFTPWSRTAAFGTNTPDNVWGPQRLYLVSVTSAYDEGRVDWRSFHSISTVDFAQLAKDRLDTGFENPDDPAGWITNFTRSDSGYVTAVTIGDAETNGFTFWQDVLVLDGEPLLPSASFEVSLTGDEYLFTSYGEGHGCGMSLQGAEGLAGEGQTFAQILGHYYPGARLMQIVE